MHCDYEFRISFICCRPAGNSGGGAGGFGLGIDIIGSGVPEDNFNK